MSHVKNIPSNLEWVTQSEYSISFWCAHTIKIAQFQVKSVDLGTHSQKVIEIALEKKIYTVPSTNIGTLGKYEQRRLWK